MGFSLSQTLQIWFNRNCSFFVSIVHKSQFRTGNFIWYQKIEWTRVFVSWNQFYQKLLTVIARERILLPIHFWNEIRTKQIRKLNLYFNQWNKKWKVSFHFWCYSHSSCAETIMDVYILPWHFNFRRKWFRFCFSIAVIIIQCSIFVSPMGIMRK